MQRASEAWDAPSYADLELAGTLANALPPWPDALGAAAAARVRDPAQLPYVVASGDPVLHAVLADEWPHEPVLAALP